MGEFLLIPLLIGSMAVGVLASVRGRNPIAWFVLAFLFTPLILGILLFLMPNLKQEEERKRLRLQRQRVSDARERNERKRDDDERRQERQQSQQVHAALLAKLAGQPAPPSSVPVPAPSDGTSGPPPLPGEMAPVWYVSIGGEKVGPLSLERIVELRKSGHVDENTLIWAPGFTDWIPLKNRRDLLGAIQG